MGFNRWATFVFSAILWTLVTYILTTCSEVCSNVVTYTTVFVRFALNDMVLTTRLTLLGPLGLIGNKEKRFIRLLIVRMVGVRWEIVSKYDTLSLLKGNGKCSPLLAFSSNVTFPCRGNTFGASKCSFVWNFKIL